MGAKNNKDGDNSSGVNNQIQVKRKKNHRKKKKKQDNVKTVSASFCKRKVNRGILTFFQVNVYQFQLKGICRTDGKL